MTNKRELNLSDKKLRRDTPEDIILKSPMKIPHKEIQDLKNLKNLNITEYAFYDISKTDKSVITYRDLIDGLPQIYNTAVLSQTGLNTTDFEMILGNLDNI